MTRRWRTQRVRKTLVAMAGVIALSVLSACSSSSHGKTDAVPAGGAPQTPAPPPPPPPVRGPAHRHHHRAPLPLPPPPPPGLEKPPTPTTRPRARPAAHPFSNSTP